MKTATNGKGDKWRKTDWKKYRESEYWEHVEKRKEYEKHLKDKS